MTDYLLNVIATTFFNQRTPLHIAAIEGRENIVKLLVKKRAEISSKDKDGVSMTILVDYSATDESLSSLLQK